MRVDGIGSGVNLNAAEKSGKSDIDIFGNYLKDALDSANDAQVKADEETTKVMTGESDDIHNALIAAEEARIQIELIMQIRNKLIESYQDINRMQI